MYKEIFKIKKNEDLTIHLPEEYLNKEIEVTVSEIKYAVYESENEVIDFSDAEVFFNRFNIDMSNFKFNRNEANER